MANLFYFCLVSFSTFLRIVSCNRFEAVKFDLHQNIVVLVKREVLVFKWMPSKSGNCRKWRDPKPTRSNPSINVELEMKENRHRNELEIRLNRRYVWIIWKPMHCIEKKACLQTLLSERFFIIIFFLFMPIFVLLPSYNPTCKFICCFRIYNEMDTLKMNRDFHRLKNSFKLLEAIFHRYISCIQYTLSNCSADCTYSDILSAVEDKTPFFMVWSLLESLTVAHENKLHFSDEYVDIRRRNRDKEPVWRGNVLWLETENWFEF